jgi:beta-lactam-binding protein with PASTA domain
VPDVTNMTLDDAKSALTASGYTAGAVGPVQEGLPGRVARTAPAANSTLPVGSAVTIYYHAPAGQ